MSKKCVVLTSSMANQLGTVNQRNMLDKLAAKRIEFEEVEAVNTDHHDRRNALIEISGKKGEFRSSFLRQMARPPISAASRSSMTFSRPTPCPRTCSIRTQICPHSHECSMESHARGRFRLLIFSTLKYNSVVPVALLPVALFSAALLYDRLGCSHCPLGLQKGDHGCVIEHMCPIKRSFIVIIDRVDLGSPLDQQSGCLDATSRCSIVESRLSDCSCVDIGLAHVQQDPYALHPAIDAAS